VNFFAGASGVGKTIMLAEWCARWRDGRTICGHTTRRPAGFAVLAADRDWSTYARAFHAAGFSDIPHYTLAEDYESSPSTWGERTALELFEASLNKLAPVPGTLVLVDPVAPLFIRGDQNRARDVAISLHWFRRCARNRSLTLICCANVGKPKMDEEYRRPQDRISGSGAFVAYSDTQIYMVGETDPVEHVSLGWTPRCAPAEEFKFQFDQNTHLFRPYTVPTSGKTKDRAAQLLPLIPDGGIDVGDLLEAATQTLHISQATFYRWISKLFESHRVQRDAYGIITTRKPS
jgi:RecA-family ATPase